MRLIRKMIAFFVVWSLKIELDDIDKTLFNIWSPDVFTELLARRNQVQFDLAEAQAKLNALRGAR